MNKIKVLFLAANPTNTTRLAIDEELRDILARVQAAEYRDAFEMIVALAVRPDDVEQALLQHKPVIVHFSGHGSDLRGLVFQGDAAGEAKFVSANAIGDLFKLLKKNVRMVFLNACYSEEQANAIVREIDFVVGMRDAIGDVAARKFAASFYRGLGFGETVGTAFRLGINALKRDGLVDDENVPALLVRRDISSDVALLSDDNERIGPLPPVVSADFDHLNATSVEVSPKEHPGQSFCVKDLRITRAASFGERSAPFLRLVVTNKNTYDMSVDKLFVDVAEFMDVDIVEYRGGGWAMAGMARHGYTCQLAECSGRYECVPVSRNYDYIRLSNGEMEQFSVDVRSGAPGVYTVRPGLEYSIGAEHHVLKFDDYVFKVYLDWESELHKENLARWVASGTPGSWVAAHQSHWDHADWMALLGELRCSAYWPMVPNAVGAVLESLKRR